jgi:hypothetical protein
VGEDRESKETDGCPLTDAFIGEEVNPEKKHHQAYTPMGEKKPGVVYKGSTEK